MTFLNKLVDPRAWKMGTVQQFAKLFTIILVTAKCLQNATSPQSPQSPSNWIEDGRPWARIESGCLCYGTTKEKYKEISIAYNSSSNSDDECSDMEEDLRNYYFTESYAAVVRMLGYDFCHQQR